MSGPFILLLPPAWLALWVSLTSPGFPAFPWLLPLFRSSGWALAGAPKTPWASAPTPVPILVPWPLRVPTVIQTSWGTHAPQRLQGLQPVHEEPPSRPKKKWGCLDHGLIHSWEEVALCHREFPQTSGDRALQCQRLRGDAGRSRSPQHTASSYPWGPQATVPGQVLAQALLWLSLPPLLGPFGSSPASLTSQGHCLRISGSPTLHHPTLTLLPAAAFVPSPRLPAAVEHRTRISPTASRSPWPLLAPFCYSPATLDGEPSRIHGHRGHAPAGGILGSCLPTHGNACRTSESTQGNPVT